MANGVMPGTGTQADPFIVEDGWDFNSLRNVTATAFSSRAWVELGADISLSMFPNFTPIPGRFFEFDGKGHTIRDVHILNGSGLFSSLFTHETKDIRIEGEIVTTITTNNSHVGLLCGSLFLETFSGAGGSISNIQAFGSITVNVNGLGTGTTRSQGTGGCFGIVQPGNWAQHGRVEDCAFYGSIQYSLNFTWPNDNSVTNSRGAGGIAGIITSDIANSNGITLSRCMSVATIVIVAGGAHVAFGGIAAIWRTFSSRPMNMSRCVAQMHVFFTNMTPATGNLMLGGIVGLSHNGPYTMALCAAHFEIMHDPQASVANELFIGGLWASPPSSSGQVLNSYAVFRLSNPNFAPWPATMVIRGIAGGPAHTGITRISSFFDATVLAEGWSGAVEHAEFGRTTSELQSEEFLSSQGWVFGDG